ncbi:MAG: hypothetical protein WCH74_04750 [Chloroflexota bacterium]
MNARSTRSATVVALALVAAILMAGCGSSTPTGTPLDVSATFSGGAATVHMTGGYSLSYPASLQRGNRYGAGGDWMSVEYGNVQTGAVTYQGPATVGTYPTARTSTTAVTLALTVVLPSGSKPSDSFASTNGECAITVTKDLPGSGEATFTCTNLANTDGSVKIDATGTWDYTVPPAP